MASLNESAAMLARRKGFGRAKKQNPKTDMTPMVDLGFLLIAFFVFTTSMSKPVVTHLNMPKDATGIPGTTLGKSNALTILLDDNNLWYYHGDMQEAINEKRILSTSFSFKTGIGKIIRDKQEFLDIYPVSFEKRDGLMLLIKATEKANYESVMNALDEALINNVKKYALIKPEKEELEYIKNQRP